MGKASLSSGSRIKSSKKKVNAIGVIMVSAALLTLASSLYFSSTPQNENLIIVPAGHIDLSSGQYYWKNFTVLNLFDTIMSVHVTGKINFPLEGAYFRTFMWVLAPGEFNAFIQDPLSLRDPQLPATFDIALSPGTYIFALVNSDSFPLSVDVVDPVSIIYTT